MTFSYTEEICEYGYTRTHILCDSNPYGSYFKRTPDIMELFMIVHPEYHNENANESEQSALLLEAQEYLRRHHIHSPGKMVMAEFRRFPNWIWQPIRCESVMEEYEVIKRLGSEPVSEFSL